jgi:hypothetical protein
MPEHAQRLLQATHLLADLVREVTADRALSYQRLADLSGLPRNVLYYFAGTTKLAKTTETSVKVDVLAKLFAWFERTDFASQPFNEKHLEVARKIEEALQGNRGTTDIDGIVEGFAAEQASRENLLESLPGIQLGVRERGSTPMFQISMHRFALASDGLHVRWEMYFKQGKEDFPNGKAPKDVEKRIQRVAGVCVKEGASVTCIGTRTGTHEMHYLVVMLGEGGTIPGIGLLGTYTTYSRKEAISRPMVIVGLSGESVDVDYVRGLNLIGDYRESDLPRLIDLNSTLSRALRYGFSVSSSEITRTKGGGDITRKKSADS